MYNSALTSRQQVLRRNQNTVRYQPIAKALGPISHGLFIALMVTILGIIYLSQVTKTAKFGPVIDELEDRKVELVSENELLEAQATRLQTLERIKNSEIAKKLEDVTGVNYVR